MYKAHQLMVMDEQSSTKGIFKKLINMYKLEYFTETTQVAMSEEGRELKKPLLRIQMMLLW